MEIFLYIYFVFIPKRLNMVWSYRLITGRFIVFRKASQSYKYEWHVKYSGPTFKSANVLCDCYQSENNITKYLLDLTFIASFSSCTYLMKQVSVFCWTDEETETQSRRKTILADSENK